MHYMPLHAIEDANAGVEVAVSPSTRWLRRRRLESDGYPDRRVAPSILADTSRRFFSARSVADEWAELPQAGAADDTQW